MCPSHFIEAIRLSLLFPFFQNLPADREREKQVGNRIIMVLEAVFEEEHLQ